MKMLYETKLRFLLNRWLNRSPLRNQWLTLKPFQLYLRKGEMAVDGNRYSRGITLASVVSTPEVVRSGKFKHVLMWMEEQLGKNVDVIHVENVFSARLQKILQRHGWTQFAVNPRDESWCLSFYKSTNKEISK